MFPKRQHLTTFQRHARAQKPKVSFTSRLKLEMTQSSLLFSQFKPNISQLNPFTPLHIIYTGPLSILLSFTSLYFLKFLKIILHAQVLSLQSHIPFLDCRSNRPTR